MTKRLIASWGLACLTFASPVFLSAAADSVLVSLPELYRIADEECRIVRISETALQSAGEQVKQARGNCLPQVRVNLSGSYIGNACLMSRGFSTTGTTEVVVPGIGPQQLDNGVQQTPHWGNLFAIEATQVLYAGGALKSGIRMAQTGERLAEINVLKNRQEVRFMLTGCWLDLIRLQNQLQVIDTHIRLTNEVLTQMQARERAGVVLHNELTRYELQLKKLEVTRLHLVDASHILSHQLQTVLHRNDVVFVPDTTGFYAAQGHPGLADSESFWQELAKKNNLDIQQAASAETLADEQVKLSRSAYIPTITAFVRDELSGPYTNDLIPVNANVNVWFVGIGIQYDLGSLWHNRHNVRKAKADKNAAQERLSLAQEQTGHAVHEARLLLETAFSEIDTRKKQVQLADENYELTEKRYQRELALLTDLLDAAGAKLEADMDLVDAKIAWMYNYYRLKYLTHTL